MQILHKMGHGPTVGAEPFETPTYLRSVPTRPSRVPRQLAGPLRFAGVVQVLAAFMH